MSIRKLKTKEIHFCSQVWRHNSFTYSPWF